MQHFRRLFLPVLLIVFAIGCWWRFSQWASAPSIGKQTASQVTAGDDRSTPEYKTIKLRTFSTRLPYNFKTRVVQNPQTSSLINVTAFAASSSAEQIGITSNALPNDGLSGVADYNFRQVNTKEYAPLERTIVHEHNGKAFQKIQGQIEVAYFITINTTYASIVVTGTKSAEEAMMLADDVLRNWQWK